MFLQKYSYEKSSTSLETDQFIIEGNGERNKLTTPV